MLDTDKIARQIYYTHAAKLSKSDRLRLASLILEDLTQNIEPESEMDISDPRFFSSLSKNERDRLLKKQAQEACELYQPESELRDWVDNYVDDLAELDD